MRTSLEDEEQPSKSVLKRFCLFEEKQNQIQDVVETVKQDLNDLKYLLMYRWQHSIAAPTTPSATICG